MSPAPAQSTAITPRDRPISGSPRGKLDPRRVRGSMPVEIMPAVGRKPANARAGGRQQPQFRTHKIAGTNEQHRSALQIEEHRQKSHTILASPTSGLTGIIFYICLIDVAKRKLFLLYCSATIEFFASEGQGQRCIFSTTIQP